MSKANQESAARHARTRSDRTSVDATNNSIRRRVLLTRSVQKDLREPRPPGKVSAGRMACDLCAPHASLSPSDGVAVDTCLASPRPCQPRTLVLICGLELNTSL